MADGAAVQDRAEAREVVVPAGLIAELGALFALGARMPRAEVQAVLEAALDALSTAGPSPAFLNVAEDARLWAVSAPPHELRAYMLAAARQTRERVLPPAMAKRLMVDLWAQLSDDDRRRFLRRADPDGRFRGA